MTLFPMIKYFLVPLVLQKQYNYRSRETVTKLQVSPLAARHK